ncbi:hypothetical protein BDR26DRAFT_852370 [Obelidium mucronatum]|nr:hypothetical protein BDR26DRAFT_852370 [Obelidium mucronatum]
MRPVHRILLSAAIAASILPLLLLDRPFARKDAPEPSLFQPYVVVHKHVNSTTRFSMPELLDFCHYGNNLHFFPPGSSWWGQSRAGGRLYYNMQLKSA